jgi:hypothetical protein
MTLRVLADHQCGRRLDDDHLGLTGCADDANVIPSPVTELGAAGAARA